MSKSLQKLRKRENKFSTVFENHQKNVIWIFAPKINIRIYRCNAGEFWRESSNIWTISDITKIILKIQWILARKFKYLKNKWHYKNHFKNSVNFGAKIEIFEKLATIILKVQNETFFGDFQTKWEFSPSLQDFS